MNTKKKKPSELELKILSVLWDHGPLTAREVLDSLGDGKERAYTSVLSVMQVMEKKGLLTRARQGMADRWRPLVRRDQIITPFLKRIVTNLFSGKPSAVLQQLLEQKAVDASELQTIKKMIRDYERQSENKND